jgi:glycine/D-amino acid oxidase-like deaminating enzyme
MVVETEVAVIGGGLVGISLAYGLALQKIDSVVIDEGDSAIRASRGNFGLVWVQGKGLSLPAYTGWAMRAASLWPDLAQRLESRTGIDVSLDQSGGLFFCVTEEAMKQRAADLQQVQQQYGAPYHFEMLDNKDLKKLVPQVGEDVAGASYSRYDGHANPIRLLQALHRAYGDLGGRYAPGEGIVGLEQRGDKFVVRSATRTVLASRIVLSAGLGNADLGQLLGRAVPVKPIRGQIIVTERLPPLFTKAMEQVRQTDNGSIMIGSTWEDVGFDTGTTLEANARMATDAIRLFPFLAGVRAVRSWSALRIMSPDAAPIYEELVPGAFLVTCHSGVSLAAIHSFEAATWIAEGKIPESMAPFGLSRFEPAADLAS